ncbi:MAG: hypothetical protein KatS3mg111_0385 [Pirellulaceae bacterium]|nr:MAG: hypothetical protein KatS3mg111_0385 [Pirellulaceae bacterium]
MDAMRYGFRIVGDCRQTRRLVDAGAAFAAYADCDDRAEVQSEAYLSAFWFGELFRRHLEQTASTKDYTGECWTPWLWFDIDRADDIQAATAEARRLCVALVERYDIDGDALLIFYSGSKGYHVGLSTSLWRPEPSVRFNAVLRRMAELLAADASIEIDSGVYDKVRAFRAPNSRHPKTGRYKRRLAFGELLSVSTAGHIERAAKPMPFELPEPPGSVDQAIRDWQTALREQTEADAARLERRRADKPARLNRQTLDFIRDGAVKGDRHRLLFSAAANLAEFGCPSALAHALLTDAALDSGLPPSEVRRQIDCGLAAVQQAATPEPPS